MLALTSWVLHVTAAVLLTKSSLKDGGSIKLEFAAEICQPAEVVTKKVVTDNAIPGGGFTKHGGFHKSTSGVIF